MSVEITASQGSAVVTWDPDQDDPRGHIARAVESDQLADALTALGASTIEHLGDDAALRRIAHATATLVEALQRRTRAVAVELRDRRGQSWAQVADALYGDPERRGSARRAYEAGRRQLGFPVDGTTANQD